MSFTAKVEVDFTDPLVSYLHFFLSHGEVKIIPIKTLRQTFQVTLKMPLFASASEKKYSIFGMDCYSREESETQDVCYMRSGIASYFLSGLTPNKTQKCTFFNPNSNDLKIGSISVTPLLVPPIQKAFFPKKDIQKSMENFIVKSFSVFKSGKLQASHSSIKNIHAPMFMARTSVLPGICYWMTPWKGFNENYLEHLGDIVENRLQYTKQEVIEGADPHKNAQFMSELCMVFPTSCSYISDFFIKNAQKHPFESFDDLFIRQPVFFPHLSLSTFQFLIVRLFLTGAEIVKTFLKQFVKFLKGFALELGKERLERLCNKSRNTISRLVF